ncbi:MAG: hypothetical protein ACI4MQ_03515 [Candidatus Coproplasma sp.]
MNKKLKIASIAVSVVMAGTMAFGVFGCNSTPNTPDDSNPSTNADLNLDANGHLTYASTTELRLNVGNQNGTKPQSPSYKANTELAGAVTMPDGKSYTINDLKPAWAALQTQLNLKLKDAFQNKKAEAQLTDPIDGTGGTMSDYDIITASASAITQNTSELVDINQYLDYMPNYKAFLEANPVTRYSLTSDTITGAMYYAPYYDGNDDIEKYCLVEQNWVCNLLDATDVSGAATTYKAQQVAKEKIAASGTVVVDATSYMGTTGSWTVATTKPGADAETVNVTVDYGAVITALGDANSELAKAVQAAIGSATIDKTSGNIVDIQNQMITESAGAVTGAQLLKVLQEYIKVAYKVDGAQLYGATVNGVNTKISDVFNATYAAWDVDLLTALCRCAVTCNALIGVQDANINNIYGISGRQGTTQRRVDVTALVGELYGIRGMESRLENLYIAADGSVKDSRLNAESYEACAKLGALAKEGLIYIGDDNVQSSRDASKGPAALMIHDYAQTQSKDCFTNENLKIVPVNTPVSKWDTDDDGTHETIMRFTESWRSVKNTGFCISKAATYGNKDKLSACLAFIDYLFSNDGQILMTYGPQSTTGNTNPNGFWYATEVEDAATSSKVEKIADATSYAPAQYKMKSANLTEGFVYNGKVYTGTAYNGTQVPTVTTANQDLYAGKEVNGFQMNVGNLKINEAYNYTNYARKIIGSTLPIGNKNQGYEYQGTAQCALDGAATVATSLLNGTIKHVKLTLDQGESLWYMICPTSFALKARQQALLKEDAQTVISGTYFLNDSGTTQRRNIYIDLWMYGFDTDQYICGQQQIGKMKTDGAAYVTFVNEDDNLTKRVNAYNTAWTTTKTYFNIGQ